MNHAGLFKIASLGLLALNLSACSSSSWLKDIQVSTQSQNNDEVVQLSANLQTGGISIGGLSIPIRSKSGTDLGSVSLSTPASGSGTQLALDIDVTTALGLPDANHDALLPNGTSIPISNYDVTKLLTFDVGSSGSKAYVLYDAAANQALIGLALVLNGINAGVSANLLLPFQIGALSGSVGPFSGAAAGQSGLALFVNASSLIGTMAAASPIPPVTGVSTGSDSAAGVHTMQARAAVAVSSAPARLVFKVSSSAKTSDQKKIENHLADLSSRRAALKAQ